jgi:hypothetical protein
VHLQTFLSIPITQKCQILSCLQCAISKWKTDITKNIIYRPLKKAVFYPYDFILSPYLILQVICSMFYFICCILASVV